MDGGASAPVTFESLYYEASETFLASGPFAPSASSNSTFAPSARDLWPSPLMELKWTNTSLPPASGVMKPYPFASLNHLTVPVAIEKHLLYQVRTGSGGAMRNRYSLMYTRTVARIDSRSGLAGPQSHC